MKKMYRIELKNSNRLAKEMALLACLSNGSKYIPLNEIEAVAKTELIRYPSLYDGITIHLIDTTLLIDRGTENLLVLTEIEVMELDQPEMTAQEAKDLLDELSPTLHRQTNTGLLDDTTPELLN